MALSLKKIPGFSEESASIRRIDLVNSAYETKSGAAHSFDLEQWPALLFLKGLGFESVKFSDQALDVVETWALRIATYQTSYLFDPENFRKEECNWSETDSQSDLVLIECIAPSKRSPREDPGFKFFVPPLEAPLGIDPGLLEKFRSEVENQSGPETLLRVHSILKEYEKDSKNKDPKIWTSLLVDIISIALESKLLDKAVELAETHRSALESLWSPYNPRVVRLFSAYEPKGAELFSWSRIFSTLKNLPLVEFFEPYLSTSAGPQMIKLMNYRVQNQSDEMAEICFRATESIQRVLLQWLSPHWREKHYPKLWKLTERNKQNEPMLKLFLNALMRSSRSRALQDLEEYFPRPRLLGRVSTDLNLQRVILNVLNDYPSIDSLEFIKKVKPNLHGKLADLAEKILSSHQKGS